MKDYWDRLKASLTDTEALGMEFLMTAILFALILLIFLTVIGIWFVN
jgi:hypothetical protein